MAQLYKQGLHRVLNVFEYASISNIMNEYLHYALMSLNILEHGLNIA